MQHTVKGDERHESCEIILGLGSMTTGMRCAARNKENKTNRKKKNQRVVKCGRKGLGARHRGNDKCTEKVFRASGTGTQPRTKVPVEMTGVGSANDRLPSVGQGEDRTAGGRTGEKSGRRWVRCDSRRFTIQRTTKKKGAVKPVSRKNKIKSLGEGTQGDPVGK